MPHVTAPAPRRRLRARAGVPLFRSPTAPIARRQNPLMAVSTQVIVGFLAPLPVIQVGHWLFGWPSVAVMWGAM